MELATQKENPGFTLIELLVVIAIIGLLASIVLIASASARKLAKNTFSAQSIVEYRNALERYNIDNGDYPVIEGSNVLACLGAGYPGGKCGLVGVAGEASETELLDTGQTLSEALSPYIRPSAFNADPIAFSAGNFVGAVYVCSHPDGKCSVVAIEWMVNGTSPNACKVAGAFSVQGAGNTLCYIFLTGSTLPPSPPPPP